MIHGDGHVTAWMGMMMMMRMSRSQSSLGSSSARKRSTSAMLKRSGGSRSESRITSREIANMSRQSSLRGGRTKKNQRPIDGVALALVGPHKDLYA